MPPRRTTSGASTPDITIDRCHVSTAVLPGLQAQARDACIRVDVFRNQRPNGNPLPTIFGTLFGVTEQGVKATATAEVLYATRLNCVRPWAIADQWEETHRTTQ